MATSGEGLDALSPVEQALVEHVQRGKMLDLAGNQPDNEATMRSWDTSRTIRTQVIRDIIRGGLATNPDPHGLRLRGARISGRVDLENATWAISHPAPYGWLVEHLVEPYRLPRPAAEALLDADLVLPFF